MGAPVCRQRGAKLGLRLSPDQAGFGGLWHRRHRHRRQGTVRRSAVLAGRSGGAGGSQAVRPLLCGAPGQDTVAAGALWSGQHGAALLFLLSGRIQFPRWPGVYPGQPGHFSADPGSRGGVPGKAHPTVDFWLPVGVLRHCAHQPGQHRPGSSPSPATVCCCAAVCAPW